MNRIQPNEESFLSAKLTMKLKTKLGIFYFPDSQHYHARAQEKWLPVFSSLGINWLVLTAENTIAVPESFIQALLDREITPIIRWINLPLWQKPQPEFELLIKAYSQWGVRYIQLFDRPNTSTFWGSKSWLSRYLVEQFIDLFLPYAETLVKYRIHPIFPALAVAQGFWDTAFLNLALASLVRRAPQELIEELVLSAYLDIYDPARPLSWGAGGQERFPQAKPYQTSVHGEDHRGLYIADWYQTLAKASVGKPLPIVLMDDPSQTALAMSPTEVHRRLFHAIQRVLDGRQREIIEIEGVPYEPLNEEILCVNFCAFSDGQAENDPRAWFLPGGEPLPLVEQLKQYIAQNLSADQETRLTPHALLMPRLEAEKLNHELEKLQPFLIQYQAKIIFHLSEASQVERLWIPAELIQLSEVDFDQLKQYPCSIHLFQLDGTSIASHQIG